MSRISKTNCGAQGACSAEYLPQKKLVSARLAGAITDADAKRQSEEAIRLLKESQASLVLIDCHEAISEISYAVLDRLPRFYSHLGVPRSARIAVVLPAVPHRLETFQFYALACRNTGYNVRLFDTSEAAGAWLQEPEVA